VEGTRAYPGNNSRGGLGRIHIGVARTVGGKRRAAIKTKIGELCGERRICESNKLRYLGAVADKKECDQSAVKTLLKMGRVIQ
jgi:hypothetical protein